MDGKLRVGLIGTSWYDDILHLPAIKSHPRAEVVAICGRNRERAQELAQKYTIPQVFTDYHEMIDANMLDALVIASPDDLHYPMTMYALEARLHVMCEKPVAMNAEQAKAMYEKAEAAGVKHMVMFTYQWMPHFQFVRDLIADGYIGQCYHASFSYMAGYGREPQYAWRFDRKRANGILGDLGSHMIELARWYLGEIAKVSGRVSTFVQRPGLDGQPLDAANDAAVLAVEFVSGAHGVIQVSAVAHVGEKDTVQQITLYGDKGTLDVTVNFGGAEAGALIRGQRHNEAATTILPVPESLSGEADRTQPFFAQILDLFVNQSAGARHFIDAILDDKPSSPSLYDGLKVQECIDAALESHQTGRWVTLP
jgi:predicted dehydrogenase